MARRRAGTAVAGARAPALRALAPLGALLPLLLLLAPPGAGPRGAAALKSALGAHQTECYAEQVSDADLQVRCACVCVMMANDFD